jgi:hypothetical protein
VPEMIFERLQATKRVVGVGSDEVRPVVPLDGHQRSLAELVIGEPADVSVGVGDRLQQAWRCGGIAGVRIRRKWDRPILTGSVHADRSVRRLGSGSVSCSRRWSLSGCLRPSRLLRSRTRSTSLSRGVDDQLEISAVGAPGELGGVLVLIGDRLGTEVGVVLANQATGGG